MPNAKLSLECMQVVRSMHSEQHVITRQCNGHVHLHGQGQFAAGREA